MCVVRVHVSEPNIQSFSLLYVWRVVDEYHDSVHMGHRLVIVWCWGLFDDNQASVARRQLFSRVFLLCLNVCLFLVDNPVGEDGLDRF